jgi:hypothetical protein
MCQASSDARGKRCTPKLGSAGWGWTGTAIALAALYHYGPFDPADHKLWKVRFIFGGTSTALLFVSALHATACKCDCVHLRCTIYYQVASGHNNGSHPLYTNACATRTHMC